MSWIRFIFHTLRNIIPDRIGVVVARYHAWMPFSPCHIILHPSFFCNYKCPYCSNQFYESRYPKSIELDYGEWLELLGKMPGSLITISGGEPLLYGNLDKLKFYNHHSIKIQYQKKYPNILNWKLKMEISFYIEHIHRLNHVQLTY